MLLSCSISFVGAPEKQKKRKIAFINTSLSNIKLNGYLLTPNRRERIDVGNNIIVFEGLVLFEINKEPIINVDKKTVTGAAVGACVAALPLCPISLLFINFAVGTTAQVEANCYGNLNFDAWEDEIYTIRLLDVGEIFPELRVVNYNNVSTASTKLECETPSQLNN